MPAMGLAERRALKGFQDNQLPALTAEIQQLAGFPVPIEINFEQLAKDDYADSYADNFRKVYFEPTIGALKAIAIDDLGKDALKAGLKKIVFCNTKDTYTAEYAVAFADGALTIDHDSCSNVDYVDDRTTALIKVLEKGL
jgi:hypothetical protein